MNNLFNFKSISSIFILLSIFIFQNLWSKETLYTNVPLAPYELNGKTKEEIKIIEEKRQIEYIQLQKDIEEETIKNNSILYKSSTILFWIGGILFVLVLLSTDYKKKNKSNIVFFSIPIFILIIGIIFRLIY